MNFLHESEIGESKEKILVFLFLSAFLVFSGFVSFFLYFETNTTSVFAADDTTSPTAPANLVSSSVSFTQINISWDASTDAVGVTGYEIFKDGGLPYITTGNAISITNGIVPGINYEFKVRAFDGAGNRSDFSNYLFVMTPFDTTPPSAPSGLTAILITTSRIDILWDASTDNVGVTKYEVYKDGVKENTVSSGVTNYSFPSLTQKTKYSFSVRALDAFGGASTMSEIFSTTTLSTILPPEAPAGLTAKTISATQVNLSWNSPPNSMYVAGYKIYKDDISSFVSKTNIFSYTGLSPDTVYLFKVTAYNSSGDESGFSNIVLAITTAGTVITPTIPENTTTTVVPPPTITKDITAPTVPTGLTATAVSSSKISLLWRASSDPSNSSGQVSKVGGYNIFRNSGFVASVSGTSYSDSGRTANKIYFYQITAYDTSGNVSARSVTVSATTLSAPVPISTPPSITVKNIPVVIPPVVEKKPIPPPAPVVAEPVASPSIQGEENEIFAIASEVPLEVFATYAETNTALKKEAMEIISTNIALSDKLDMVQNIRDGYALAPEDPNVTIGKMVFSRISSPEKAIARVQEILKGRTPELILIDTDGDGVSDYDEIGIYGTDQKMKDTDGDELTDWEEILAGVNPLDKNIAPVAYENPKTNTVFATTSPELFTVDKTEAILSPSLGGSATKVAGVFFTGKALPNGFVTIYIFSTQIFATVQTDKDGNWTYIVNKDLKNGEHEMYLTMTQSDGKIIAKSDPIVFTKTNEAVSLGRTLPVVVAPTANQGFIKENLSIIIIGVIASFAITGITIFIIKRKRKLLTENIPESF